MRSGPAPVLACIAYAVAAFTSAQAEQPAGDIVAGRRLYWEGRGADGAPVNARTQGDIAISGAQFSCVSCHRPSAYGSSEGGVYVPPIRGDFLYEASHGDRNRIFKELYQEVQSKEFWAKMRDPRSRPAYTDETLARAIADGVDSAGRVLSPTMPRYSLSRADTSDIVAYLRSLSGAPDPGVTRNELHFATIVTPGVNEEDAASVISTITAFFDWKNLHTKGDLSSPGFSPLYRSEFLNTYRAWKLHVWKLEGEPETWGDQLDAFNREQPVFAMVGGLVKGPHSPIADFCDRTATPCIFPSTELPQTRDVAYRYNIYFSRGRELEGETMAAFVLTEGGKQPEVRQYFLEDRLGSASALAFQRYAGSRGARVISQGFPTQEKLSIAIAECCDKNADALVIWPGETPDSVVGKLATKSIRKIPIVGLPSDAIAAAKVLEPKAVKNFRFAYPYEKPGVIHPREFDVRAWMSARKIRVTNPRLQFEAYFALTMIEHSLQHLLGDFNREYLIELIEHEAEKNLNIGTHPALALGPGQRFASKGAFIMRLDPKAEQGIAPSSGWVVP